MNTGVLDQKIRIGRKKVTYQDYIQAFEEIPIENVKDLLAEINIKIPREVRMMYMKRSISHIIYDIVNNEKYDDVYIRSKLINFNNFTEIQLENLCEKYIEHRYLIAYKEMILFEIFNRNIHAKEGQLKGRKISFEITDECSDIKSLSLKEFNRLTNRFFIDVKNEIEGVPIESLKEILKSYASKHEVEEIMTKHDIEIPKVLTKDEIVEEIITQLGFNIENDPEAIAYIKNMSRTQLIAFIFEKKLNIIVKHDKDTMIDLLYDIAKEQAIHSKRKKKHVIRKIYKTLISLFIISIVSILTYGIVYNLFQLPSEFDHINNYIKTIDIYGKNLFEWIFEFLIWLGL